VSLHLRQPVAPEADPPPAADESAPCPRLRILVAEDNIVNQRILVRLLEKLDCRVDVASDGVETVEMMDRFSYHLLLMDCHMPRLDGCETAAAIRRREQVSGRRTKIVALAAGTEDRDRCLLAGMDDFLSKPIDAHTLSNLVEELSRQVSAGQITS